MGDNFWEATQLALQNPDDPLIKKPKLTENLLKKPPFRFLHDIVSEVLKTTGFPEGLYDASELNSANIKDKDSKVTYLNKIIDCVGLATSSSIPARPLKVVAGLEPENTNIFLQALAEAARAGPGTDAVARVLAGEHQSEGGAAPQPGPSAPPPASIEVAAPSEPPPLQQPPEPLAPPPPPPQANFDEPVAKAQPFDDVEKEAAPEAPVQQLPVRPMSARRPPPKTKSNVVQSTDQLVSASSGGVQAPVPQLFTEGADDDGDDEVEVVVETTDALSAGNGGDDAGGAKGHLVADLLEAKESAAQAAEEVANLDSAPKETGIILGSRRNKSSTVDSESTAISSAKKEDVESIREMVQNMCQSTNPLGKCMDFLLEDADAMNKELRHWQQEARTFADQSSRDAISDSLTRAQQSLDDVEEQIVHMRGTLDSTKAQVLHNDEQISRLLAAVARGV